MSAFYDLASLVLVASGYKASKVYAQKPLTTDGQLTFSRASTATRVNSAGLIETVSSNVPRLDYTNSTCPRLLLEPQRTNLLLWSENFDNATWVKIGTTVTANNAVSPDGSTNADALVENTATSLHDTYQAFVSTSSTAYTFSCYIKPSTRTRAYLRSDTSAGTVRTLFDLTGSGSVVTLNHTSASISLVGNGWYRCSITFTEGTGAAGRLLFVEGAVGTSVSYAGNGLTAFWIYGAQLEAGAYATSYIPTLGAAVTRGADSMTKSAISGLIGQTEGVIFMDFVYSTPEQTRININSGSSQNWVFFGAPESVTSSRVYIRASGIVSVDTTTNLTGVFVVGQRYKVALAYKSGDWAIAINGTIRTSGTQTFTFNAPLTTAIFSGNVTSEPSAQQGTNNVNQALLFKTRLTNAQLAELTAL